MDTSKLKKFAQFARRSLMEQVTGKLKLVLSKESAARRENPQAVQELEAQIATVGEEQVIEKVAYTWFNRFCALRFMDVNRYTRLGLVSPAEGQFQPEILSDAKMGHIDEEMVPERIRRQILALLEGTQPSPDPQTEAYRLLLVAACNHYHKAMPYLFERIDDFTELLMPDDLLSGSSILAYTREALTPDACNDVEVIGWLYQFYISEKKDEVFEGLKKNKKITPENIPAATQLFTPHWIVRYLVENSLGRLWMLNRPNSKLISQMDYYIQPEEPETDFLKIGSPEEIKICDPACGSGHMLVYAFDLLHAIYEEEGYEAADIPEKILTHNLYGIEIDERAGTLAAFALTMKARARQRRFFGRGCKPNICVLQNVHFDEGELTAYMDFVGRYLFTLPLMTTLQQFEEADNFGSLIRPEVTDVGDMLGILEGKSVSGELLLRPIHERVLQVLRQADYLSPKYHVVIANPPYMGGGGMNGRLKTFSQENFQDSRADLYAMFIERNIDLARNSGSIAMITMQSWMFLSSFESLRSKILNSDTILSMAHLGARAFDSIGGEVVSTTGFVIKKLRCANYRGSYIDLTEGSSEAEKSAALLSTRTIPFFTSSAELKKIPGTPIAYWVKDAGYRAFSLPPMSELGSTRRGLQTGNKEKFIRSWFECEYSSIEWKGLSKEAASQSHSTWFQFNNGGSFRKWYGNLDLVVNWRNDGKDIKNSGNAIIPSESLYFEPAVCWARLTTGNNAFRLHPHGTIPGDLSPCFYSHELDVSMSYYNSNCANFFLNAINPTITKTVGDVARIPSFPRTEILNHVAANTKELITVHCQDWAASETSWDFTSLPLQQSDYRQQTMKATYEKIRAHWREKTLAMRKLEEENNRIFIEAYGLDDELTPEVPLNEITLTCNPHYRYGNDKSEDELEALLLWDTMKEFISYAVGCMFGRYALDKPGLILANQGETIEDCYKALEISEDSIEPGSVRLKRGAEAKCFRCGCRMKFDDALFVLHRYEADQAAGRPMVYCKRCADEYGDLSVRLPLAQFCFKTAITQHWSQRSTLEQFLEMAECFEYETVKNKRDAALFPADEDNVIPIIDGDWFADDITERFYNFLRVTFGEAHFEENLQFLEKAIGKDVRKYFLKDFYNDHVKRYKKRPIYWLFSSPKGSFNALIYMHRYRPDTVSVVLNNYLREFRTKLSARKGHLETLSISASASQGEKTKALKEIEKLNKTIEEMEDYERKVLYPLATEQIAIDLDDGVKVNYLKFGAALKKITGLDKAED